MMTLFFYLAIRFKRILRKPERGSAMKKPNGLDLLATLIDLLADQEGVKITYELETERTVEYEANQTA